MDSSLFPYKDFLAKQENYPGVYQMFDKHGEILYVGKAANLKKRLSSYFRSTSLTTRTLLLVNQIAKIETIITNSESEALLLESNLIKKYRPRFNVLLKDDKSYPYILVSGQTDYRKITFYRGPKKVKGRLFGPYPSGGAVRETLNLIQKIFLIRSCEETFFKNRTRPCLQYQIKRCSAPCVKFISVTDYQQDLNHALQFLQGDNQKVLDDLINKMEKASESLDYEAAAKYRDQVISVRRVQEKQYVTNATGDADVVAAVNKQGVFCVVVHSIRHGRLLGHKVFFPTTPKEVSETEVLQAFLSQYYLNSIHSDDVPKEIIVNQAYKEKASLEEALTTLVQHSVKIIWQVRTQRQQWLTMAKRNAEFALTKYLADKAHYYDRMLQLQDSLSLDELPHRIECFDVSHTGGESAVASCVVFDLNGPVKKAYRSYNIEGITGGDDYAAMYQALLRRYSKLKLKPEFLPDVVFIDGGKGQLTQAKKVFAELQLEAIELISIAKGTSRKPGLEELHFAERDKVLVLEADDEGLHLIQQIRDEAHRFAITQHRKRRSAARNTSVLQTIPGIGKTKRRDLLRQFGGLQEIKRASIEELTKVPGISTLLAEKIYQALHGD